VWHATIGEPVSQPISSSVDIQWKIVLAIWTAATALSLVGWLIAPHRVLS
jgi:cyanate permease